MASLFSFFFNRCQGNFYVVRCQLSNSRRFLSLTAHLFKLGALSVQNYTILYFFFTFGLALISLLLHDIHGMNPVTMSDIRFGSHCTRNSHISLIARQDLCPHPDKFHIPFRESLIFKHQRSSQKLPAAEPQFSSALHQPQIFPIPHRYPTNPQHQHHPSPILPRSHTPPTPNKRAFRQSAQFSKPSQSEIESTHLRAMLRPTGAPLPPPPPAEHGHRKVPSYRKAMWSQTEDDRLLAAVNRLGTNNWGLIAAEVSGRTGKQCRERWAGILNPALTKQPWTEEEDKLLEALHAQYGNKWALIAMHIKGRSTIALRNRWSWHRRHAQNLAKAVMPPMKPMPIPPLPPDAPPMMVPPPGVGRQYFPQMEPFRILAPRGPVVPIQEKLQWVGAPAEVPEEKRD